MELLESLLDDRQPEDRIAAEAGADGTQFILVTYGSFATSSIALIRSHGLSSQSPGYHRSTLFRIGSPRRFGADDIYPLAAMSCRFHRWKRTALPSIEVRLAVEQCRILLLASKLGG